MKVLEIKLNSATKAQIKKQYELRLSGFQSNALLDMAEYFMKNGVKRCITFDELRGLVKTDKGRVYTMVAQLKATHGFDIINHSVRGAEGVYQMVGFTLRNRDKEKKEMVKQDRQDKLINSVFC